MVPFHRARKQLSGCQRLGAEGKSQQPKGARELLRDDGNVFCGNDIAFAQLYTFVKTHLIIHLPMADFTACKLLLNKVDLNIQYSFFVFLFFPRRVLAGELELKFPLCSCIAVNP